jgi:O-antigen ligase/polysaccharide polymerase Wzy-like membrane protein
LKVLRGNDLQPAVVPALLALAVFAVLGLDDAGSAPTTWYPAGLFLLVLLVICVWLRRDLLGGYDRPLQVSIAAFAALAAWTFASIGWSEVKGDAWDGANRGLVYLVVYALFAALALSGRTRALLLGAYALFFAVAGLVVFVAASRSANPDSYFLLARFSEPTGYQNANSALFALAFWPALFLSSRREVPLAVRAVMLGAAGVLVEIALLSQSRGWVVAMPLTYVLYVGIVPSRVRTLVHTVPIALAVVLARGPLLDVFPALQSGDGVSAALRDARTALFVTAVVLIAVGALISLADDRLRQRPELERRLARAAALAFAAAAAVAAVGVLVWAGNPATRVSNAWDEFKGKAPPLPTASYFSSGFGSNRYDIWRVAARQVRREPIVGVGSDNFAVDYLRERRSDEEPAYPHSLVFKVVAQTGIVGGVLFVLFLGAGVLGWWRRRNAETPFADGVRAVGLVTFAYWLVHASVDWFWELPGLAAPAIAFLGLAVGPGHRAGGAPRRWLLPAVSAVAVVAALSLVFPWLAAKEVQAAAGEWRRSPEHAFARLDRARALNPLSDRADVISGAIASRLSRTQLMADSFSNAIARNTNNWYSQLELAVAEARLGRRADALGHLRRAAELNPREPTIREIRGKVLRGDTIDTAALDGTFLRRTFVSNRTDGP